MRDDVALAIVVIMGGVRNFWHLTIMTFPWRIQSSNDLEHSRVALGLTRRFRDWVRCAPWVMIGQTTIDMRSLLRTLFSVTTVTATKARSALYALIDEANRSHEPIQITGKRGNAVLISEEDWRSIEETLFLNSIPGMVESIKKAREEGINGSSEKLDW